MRQERPSRHRQSRRHTRDMTTLPTHRCPNCGCPTSSETCYADRADRDDECSLIVWFCAEACADSYHESGRELVIA